MADPFMGNMGNMGNMPGDANMLDFPMDLDFSNPTKSAIYHIPQMMNTAVQMLANEGFGGPVSSDWMLESEQTGHAWDVNDPVWFAEDFDPQQFWNNAAVGSMQIPTVEPRMTGPSAEPMPITVNTFNTPNPYVTRTSTTTTNSLKRGASSDYDDDEEEGEAESPASSSPPEDKLKARSGKRLKRIENGYPCNYCAKTFDRAADRDKHQNRAHKADDQKKHCCQHCSKRFHYPKDVVRHINQRHPIVGRLSALNARPGRATVQVSSDGKVAQMSFHTMGVVGRSIAMFRNLVRLRRQSTVEPPDEAKKFILVTKDRRDFRMLDVSSVTTYDNLVEKLRKELDLSDNQDLRISRHELGGRVQEPMSAEDTMTALKNDANAQGSLKLYLSNIKTEAVEES